MGQTVLADLVEEPVAVLPAAKPEVLEPVEWVVQVLALRLAQATAFWLAGR